MGLESGESCWQLKSRDLLFGKMALGQKCLEEARADRGDCEFWATDGGGSGDGEACTCEEVQELGSAGIDWVWGQDSQLVADQMVELCVSMGRQEEKQFVVFSEWGKRECLSSPKPRG